MVCHPGAPIRLQRPAEWLPAERPGAGLVATMALTIRGRDQQKVMTHDAINSVRPFVAVTGSGTRQLHSRDSIVPLL